MIGNEIREESFTLSSQLLFGTIYHRYDIRKANINGDENDLKIFPRYKSTVPRMEPRMSVSNEGITLIGSTTTIKTDAKMLNLKSAGEMHLVGQSVQILAAATRLSPKVL